MTPPLSFNSGDVAQLVARIRALHQHVRRDSDGQGDIEQELLQLQRDAVADWLDASRSSSPASDIVYLVLNFMPHRGLRDPVSLRGAARRFEAIINCAIAAPPTEFGIPAELSRDKAYLRSLRDSVRLYGDGAEPHRSQLVERWTAVWGTYSALTSRLEDQGFTTLNHWLLTRASAPADICIAWCPDLPPMDASPCVVVHCPSTTSMHNHNPFATDAFHSVPEAVALPLAGLLRDDGDVEPDATARAKCMLHFLAMFYGHWGGHYFTSIPIVHSGHSRESDIGRTSVLSVCTSTPPTTTLISQLRLIAHEIFNPLVRHEDLVLLRSYGWKPSIGSTAGSITVSAAAQRATGAKRLSALWLSTSPPESDVVHALATCNIDVKYQSGESLSISALENSSYGADCIVVDAAGLRLSPDVVRQLRPRSLGWQAAPEPVSQAIMLGQWLRSSPLIPAAIGVVPSTATGRAVASKFPVFHSWQSSGELGAIADAIRTAHSEYMIARAAVLESMPELDVVEGGGSGHDKMLDALAHVQSFGAMGRPIVLLGKSGTGKTGLAKHFWRAFLRPQILDPNHRLHGNFKSAMNAAFPGIGAGKYDTVCRDVADRKDAKRYEQAWADVARCLPFVTARMTTADGLLKSELHGHLKGSFTDAHERHFGLLERANGSVLFLDEIHRLSPVAQRLLIDFIQSSYSTETQWCKPIGWRVEGTPTRLLHGKETSVKAPVSEGIDVRVLIVSAASVESYDELISDQSYSAREPLDADFIRRLGSPVAVPSLRDRILVIPELLTKLGAKVWKRYSADPPEITNDAAEWVQTEVLAGRFEHGNVAELQSLLLDVAITKGKVNGDQLVPPRQVDAVLLAKELERRGHDGCRTSGAALRGTDGPRVGFGENPDGSSRDLRRKVAEALVDEWERDPNHSTNILQKHSAGVYFHVLEILGSRGWTRAELAQKIKKDDGKTAIGSNALTKVLDRCFEEMGRFPAGFERTASRKRSRS